jgi:hypothetical protein
MDKLVIVKAWNGEPRALEGTKSAIYVESTAVDVEGADSPPPVGVPIEDAFAFNKQAFDRLFNDWKTSQVADDGDWRELEPANMSAPSKMDTENK